MDSDYKTKKHSKLKTCRVLILLVQFRLITGLLLLAITSSCIADKKPSVNMQLENDILSFENPPLEMRIKAEVKSVEKEKSPRKVVFSDENASPLSIEFFNTLKGNTLEFYYDLKYIVHSNNLSYVGPAYFGDHEWAKVLYADVEGYLAYGYITLKGDQFIYVYMVDGIGAQKIRPFVRFQNKRKIPNKAREYINSLFEKFNKYATIRF